MSVRVAIVRRVPEGQVEAVRPFLLRLRSLAMEQPGYVSGETLVHVDDPEEVMVLSSWTSVDAWRRWEADPRRRELADQTNIMLGNEPDCRIYQHG